MSNRLASAMSRMADRFEDHGSETVTVSDGTYTVSLAATLQRTEMPLDVSEGMQVGWEPKDFVITAADLVLNSVTVEPQAGMRITRGSKVYAVQPQENGKCWRWCDATEVMMRIHTVRVT